MNITGRVLEALVYLVERPGQLVEKKALIEALHRDRSMADDYARLMQRTHSKAATLVDIPGAGHFDLVTPGTPAWKAIEARIASALQVGS